MLPQRFQSAQHDLLPQWRIELQCKIAEVIAHRLLTEIQMQVLDSATEPSVKVRVMIDVVAGRPAHDFGCHLLCPRWEKYVRVAFDRALDCSAAGIRQWIVEDVSVGPEHVHFNQG